MRQSLRLAPAMSLARAKRASLTSRFLVAASSAATSAATHVENHEDDCGDDHDYGEENQPAGATPAAWAVSVCVPFLKCHGITSCRADQSTRVASFVRGVSASRERSDCAGRCGLGTAAVRTGSNEPRRPCNSHPPTEDFAARVPVVEGAREESARQDGGESPEAGPPMLDPTWTYEKGYAHALALLSRIEHGERSFHVAA